MDKLGVKIKEFRLLNRISQTQLAQNICDRSLISKIENGYHIPNADILYKLCLKLSVPFEQLLHLCQYSNFDYIKEFIYFVRKSIELRDYKEVKKVLDVNKTSPEFRSGFTKSFILWHEGIIASNINKDYKMAHQYLENALLLLKDFNHFNGKIMEIEILNTLGNTYVSEEKYPKAEKCFLDALSLIKRFEHLELSEIKIRIYFNLSVLYIDQKKYEQSIIYCDKGISNCKQKNLLYSLADLYYHKALNFVRLGRDGSEKYFDYALILLEIQEKYELYAFAKARKEKYINRKEVKL